MSDTELMKYFKFDQADRLANQAGRITKKQQARFLAEDQTNRKWNKFWGVLLLVIAALGLVVMAYGWIRYPGDIAMASVFLLAGGIWALVGGTIGGIVLGRLNASNEFMVAKVHGHARIVDVQSSYAKARLGIHQELHIGGKRFVATRTLAGILPEREYTVYYLDRPGKKPAGGTYPSASEDILSVEMIDPNEPTPTENVPENGTGQA